jgi:hypothetical protein
MSKFVTPEEQARRQRKLDKDRADRQRVLARKQGTLAHEARNTREDLDKLFAPKEPKT